MKCRTVLRVKRRRCDPAPPDTFKLHTSATTNGAGSADARKRSRKSKRDDDDEDGTAGLTSMLNQTSLSFLNQERKRNENDNDYDKNTIHADARGTNNNNNESVPIVFRRVTDENGNNDDDATSLKRKMEDQYEKHEHVKVVDATLDLLLPTTATTISASATATAADSASASEKTHPHKRPRINLQMVDSTIMKQQDFWNERQKNNQSAVSASASASASASQSAKSGTTSTSTSTSTANAISNTNRRAALRERMKRIATTTSASSGNQRTNKTPSKQSKSRRILDPLTKRIDESLLLLHSTSSTSSTSRTSTTASPNGNGTNGDPTHAILQHLNLLQIQSQSLTFQPSHFQPQMQSPSQIHAQSQSHKVNWQCTNGSGTILHHCALLHSVEGTRAICQFYAGVLVPPVGSAAVTDSVIDFDARDGDGRTALDVAEMAGCREVLDVLQRFSCWDADAAKDQKEDQEQEQDQDFVYDVYCLEDWSPTGDREASTSNTSGSSATHAPSDGGTNARDGNAAAGDSPSTAADDDNANDAPIVVNMRGGVGYWNEDGELVLDVFSNDDMEDSEVDEEEYDSNREDCDANDYPDDDVGLYNDDDAVDGNDDDDGDGEMGMLAKYNGDWDSDDSDYGSNDDDGIDFRNRAVDKNFFGSPYNDEDDGDYRGFMHGADSGRFGGEHNGAYMTEAYDPDRDEEDD
jgi:hypothetical protein